MRPRKSSDCGEKIMADPTADVLVDGPLSAEREALISQALATLGVSGRIRVLPLRRGASELQWLILMTLPLQAFLTSIGGKFGEDAYRGFQNIIRRLFRPEQAAPAAASRPIVLKDAASGLQIVLDTDLPRATSNCSSWICHSSVPGQFTMTARGTAGAPKSTKQGLPINEVVDVGEEMT
jgi:hypothetical protein